MSFLWTGAAVSAGTTASTGNINTAGNGDTVSYLTSGTFTTVYASNGGLSILGTTTGISRLDCSRTAGLYGVARVVYTAGQDPVTANGTRIEFRSASATVAACMHQTNGKWSMYNSAGATITASVTPIADVVGHTYQIDMFVVVGTTTSNGRAFFRIKDLTDPTWNTTGYWFYDTGATINTGIVNCTVVRFGKIGSDAVTTPFIMREMGWDAPASVDATATEAAATAQFLAAPIVDGGTVAMVGGNVMGLTASQTETGSAAMVGGNVMAVVPAITELATVTMTGANVLGVTSSQSDLAAAAMVGANTMGVTPLVAHPASVAMTGANVLGAAPLVAHPLSVSMVGAGVMGVTPSVSHPATVAMSGSNTLGVAISGFNISSAPMTGANVMAVGGVLTQSATVPMIGSNILGVGASRQVLATVAMIGGGVLTISGTVTAGSGGSDMEPYPGYYASDPVYSPVLCAELYKMVGPESDIHYHPLTPTG